MAGPVRRKPIPKKLRAIIALRQNGLCACGCGERLMPGFHIDHEPPLDLRLWDEATQDTIPPANDPDHLFGKTPNCHRRKTNHPLGPHTTLNSDSHAIAKGRRLRGEVQGRPQKKWPSRGFSRKGHQPRVRDIHDD